MGEDFIITADRGQIIGRRKQQEDSLGGGIAADGSIFFVLADGMGGHAGGRQASQAAVAAFSQAMHERVDLRHALNTANACLAYMKEKGQMPESAGCTLIGVSLAHGECRAISVGDSLFYHFSEKQGLRLLNMLHNKGAELDMLAANGQITVEQALNAPQRNALTSAVTGSPFRWVHELEPFSLAPGDRLVLASDGCLTLGEKKIESLLRHQNSHRGAEPKMLIDDILRRVEAIGHPAQDNTSLIIIQASQPEPDTETKPFTGFSKSKKHYPTAFSWQLPVVALGCIGVLALALTIFAVYPSGKASYSTTRPSGHDDAHSAPIKADITLTRQRAVSDPAQAWVRLRDMITSSDFGPATLKAFSKEEAYWKSLPPEKSASVQISTLAAMGGVLARNASAAADVSEWLEFKIYDTLLKRASGTAVVPDDVAKNDENQKNTRLVQDYLRGRADFMYANAYSTKTLQEKVTLLNEFAVACPAKLPALLGKVIENEEVCRQLLAELQKQENVNVKKSIVDSCASAGVNNDELKALIAKGMAFGDQSCRGFFANIVNKGVEKLSNHEILEIAESNPDMTATLAGFLASQLNKEIDTNKKKAAFKDISCFVANHPSTKSDLGGFITAALLQKEKEYKNKELVDYLLNNTYDIYGSIDKPEAKKFFASVLLQAVAPNSKTITNEEFGKIVEEKDASGKLLRVAILADAYGLPNILTGMKPDKDNKNVKEKDKKEIIRKVNVLRSGWRSTIMNLAEREGVAYPDELRLLAVAVFPMVRKEVIDNYQTVTQSKDKAFKEKLAVADSFRELVQKDLDCIETCRAKTALPGLLQYAKGESDEMLSRIERDRSNLESAASKAEEEAARKAEEEAARKAEKEAAHKAEEESAHKAEKEAETKNPAPNKDKKDTEPEGPVQNGSTDEQQKIRESIPVDVRTVSMPVPVSFLALEDC